MSGTARSDDAAHQQAAAEQSLPSVRVVTAVADATGDDPLEMAPLYDAVDPDALDQLLDGDLQGHVQFAYDGHEVTVRGDGTVVVDGREREVQ